MKEAVLHPRCPRGAVGGEASVSQGAALAPGAFCSFLKALGCVTHLTRVSLSSYSMLTCIQNEPLAVRQRQLLAVMKQW